MSILKPVTNLPPWADTGDKTQPVNTDIATGFPHTPNKPTRQVMNWALNYASNGVLYLTSRGVPDWDSIQNYIPGDVVRSKGKFYSATANNANLEPSVNPTQWVLWYVFPADLNQLYVTPAQVDATYLRKSDASSTYATLVYVNSHDASLQSQINSITAVTGKGYFAGSGIAIDTNNYISNTEPNVQADWKATSGLAQILNQPPLTYDGTSASNLTGSLITTGGIASNGNLSVKPSYIMVSSNAATNPATIQLMVASTTAVAGDPVYFRAAVPSVICFDQNAIALPQGNATSPQIQFGGKYNTINSGAGGTPGNFHITMGCWFDQSVSMWRATLVNAGVLNFAVDGKLVYSAASVLTVGNAFSPVAVASISPGKFQIYSADATAYCQISCANTNGVTTITTQDANTGQIHVTADVHIDDGWSLFLYGHGTSASTFLQLFVEDNGNPKISTSNGQLGFANLSKCTFYFMGGANTNEWIAISNPTYGSLNIGVQGGTGATVAAGPYLWSSTGTVSIQSSLNVYSAIFVYSPDQSRYLRVSLANGASPDLASTTGVITCSAAFQALDGAGVQIFSPDYTHYLQINCVNGGNPTLSSSTTVIATSSLLQCNNASGIAVYSPDSVGYIQIYKGVSDNPVINSTTGTVNFTAAVEAFGFKARAGWNGALSGNNFNINYAGAAQLWIDSTNLGNISISSDYRIKTDIEKFDGALPILNKLRPVKFRYRDVEDDIFKSDGIAHVGLIAHEVQELLPGAAYGEKDALTSDGKIQPQSLNSQDLIALLCRAVQELSAKVDSLEARRN